MDDSNQLIETRPATEETRELIALNLTSASGKRRDSFVELSARSRAAALLDPGTFRELLGPFDRLESLHLAMQDIVPQADDGVIVARGTIDGASAVVLSIEGAFQGGGIGEVSGSKIAGALELAVRDNEAGIRTRAVIILDTGGVRLQEANYGLLGISEIQSAIVALRRFAPVVGVIPGKVGCFGGMSMTAGLMSRLIITAEGRLTLNGPEVIEQEAGIAEWDSKDKAWIWASIGGVQRHAVGLADVLVEDDAAELRKAVLPLLDEPSLRFRSEQVGQFMEKLSRVDPASVLTPELQRISWSEHHSISWSEHHPDGKKNTDPFASVSASTDLPFSRGRTWFNALTSGADPLPDGIPSVLCADAQLCGETVRCISVVPDPNGRFPRARHGEVGVEEGWTLARHIRDAMTADANASDAMTAVTEKPVRRPILAIVDVPSQAYGYKEEMLGLFLSCAGAVDAYASARYAGHPVIALLVGPAISGAFLAHGYQANRILALDDPGVLVHAMSKQSAARITKRSVAELEESSRKVPSIAYDIRSFDTLGALHALIAGVDADAPTQTDVDKVVKAITNAIADARNAPRDLGNRLTSEQAMTGRAASREVRRRLQADWNG